MGSRKTIETAQGIVVFVGILLGIIPLIGLLIGRGPMLWKLVLSAESHTAHIAAPAIALAVSVIIVIVLERAKKSE